MPRDARDAQDANARRFAELEADRSIRALVFRYADAVCRGDVDAWRATWADDAVWEIGRGPAEGIDAIVAAFERAMGLFDSVVQIALSGEASLGAGGDTATGRWYMQEHSCTRSGHRLLYLGYYDDEYVRDEATGEWRFARRELAWLYQGDPDLSGTFGPPPGYATA
ncbi:MAG: nuclear transport factor 2 family protein [Acidimicrobiia bacterium]|nr:nuclear transport factor 2 family protein [Acidimicrobiia bacterium]